MNSHPMIDVDHVTTDPSVLDTEYPPEHFVTHFRTNGDVVHASLWIAQGKQPKRMLVLAPQMYGGDRLESLIIPLVNSGTSVLTFQPRGMWDGNGQHTLVSAMEDVNSAVEFLRTADERGQRTPSGAGYRVDPSKVGVFGISGGGGGVAMAACAENDDVAFAIAMAPQNLELIRDLAWLDQPENSASMAEVTAETAGRVDMPKMLRGMREEDFDRLSIITQAPRLARKKMLLVGAAHDASTPVEYHHVPIAKALQAAGAASLTEVILDTDHLFLTKRVALARLVVSWLRAEFDL